jgi:hypothetical protein
VIEYEAVPYDRDKHEGFVRASWTRGARLPWDELVAHLRRPETRCLVAHVPGDPEALLGWAAVVSHPDTGGRESSASQGAVIWAYTRDLYGRIRRRGLMTSLLLDMGVDVSEPTPCLYWSPAASDIAARGYRVFFAPKRRKRSTQRA